MSSFSSLGTRHHCPMALWRSTHFFQTGVRLFAKFNSVSDSESKFKRSFHATQRIAARNASSWGTLWTQLTQTTRERLRKQVRNERCERKKSTQQTQLTHRRNGQNARMKRCLLMRCVYCAHCVASATLRPLRCMRPLRWVETVGFTLNLQSIQRRSRKLQLPERRQSTAEDETRRIPSTTTRPTVRRTLVDVLIIGGRWFSCHLKGLMRLPISHQ